jgi:hypothetical protein
MRPDPSEPIEVALADGAPAQFLLRGRLLVVRRVLARWVEPGGWRWSGPGRVVAEPVPAGVGAGGDSVGAGGEGGDGGEVTVPPVIHSVPVDLADREVWRVEAAAGRSARPAVFDLCREPDQERPRWTATLVEE